MFSFFLQGKVGDMMAPIKSPEAQLLIAIQNRQQDKIRELLEVQGVGANFANNRGVRPMHMACQSGDMPLVQRLLELGADSTTPDKAGNTPLHYAAKGGHTGMVRMLVGQGVMVEKRNAARMTAYDVATDHVIRQFLLPLQLKAEAGNPEYAVHAMGITTDGPRSFEKYGAPGLAQPLASHGQAYRQSSSAPSSSDPMSAALGALMQAPSIAPPRPAAAYRQTYTPPRQPGSLAPPDAPGVGYPGQSADLPSPPVIAPSATHPTRAPSSMVPPQAPFPAVGSSGSAAAPSTAFAFPSPSPDARPAVELAQDSAPQAEASATTGPVGAVSSNPPSGGAGQPFLPEVVVQIQPPAAEGKSQAASTEDIPDTGGARTAVDSGASKLFSEGEGCTAPDAVVVTGKSEPLWTNPASTVERDEGINDMKPSQPGVSATYFGAESKPAAPVMAAVDLASKAETSEVVSGTEISLGAGVAGLSAPPFSPHAATAPQRGHASTLQPPPGPPPSTGDTPGGFKPIKADGFHSSASDKALQLRYGHTRIVRDVGAPPTAAQLGAPPMAMQPRGGPPLARPNDNGFGSGGLPPSHYPMPPSGHYGQPFGGGGGAQAVAGVGAFGQTRPPPHFAAATPETASYQHGFPRPTSNPRSGSNLLPTPGACSPPRAAFPPSGSVSRGGGEQSDGAGSYNVFNPTTDRIVSADSSSSAIL